MDVFYLSDDKFCEIFGVSVISLFECNKDVEKLTVYLIEYNISDNNKKRILKIAKKYHREIILLPMKPLKELIGTDMYIPPRLSVVDFSRLFATSILPNRIDKIIQLDCDLIIKRSLNELWNFNLQDNYVAMINEGHSSSHRSILGIPAEGAYYNSGVMLMNLKRMREDGKEKEFVEYMKAADGYIPVNAQGVFNAVLQGRIALLPQRFNVHPLLYAFSYDEFLKLRKPTEFYGREEVENAVSAPVIIHFMTCFYMDVRPWMEGCIHPKKDEYLNYKAISPWSDTALWPSKRNQQRKLYFQIVHHIPRCAAIALSSFIYTKLIPWDHRKTQRKFHKIANKRSSVIT